MLRANKRANRNDRGHRRELAAFLDRDIANLVGFEWNFAGRPVPSQAYTADATIAPPPLTDAP